MISNDLHEIKIAINKARIEAIAFSMKEENSIPGVSVSLSLLSVGGNKVTDVTLSTNAWNDTTKFKNDDIPLEVYDHIAKIRELLSPACIRKINSIDKFLQ